MSFYSYKKFLIGAVGTMMLAGTASATCDLGYTCRLAEPDPNVKIIPFSAPATTSISEISSHTVPGLGPNERLCPVTCPVDVEVSEGGKVLGCYDICKPIAPVQNSQSIYKPPTFTQTQNVSYTQQSHSQQTQGAVEHVVKYEPYLVNPVVQTTHVRVIRPVIYVRYPVPVPVTPCGQIIYGPTPRC